MLSSRLTKFALLISCSICVVCHHASPAKSKPAVPVNAQKADAVRFAQMLNELSADQAEQQISDYLKTNVDSADVREVHAESLYKLGRYHYAVDELTKAMQTRIDNPEDALLMGKICQSMHKTKDAVQWYKKFITLSPKDERVAQYETLQRVLEESLVSDAEKHRRVRSEAGNYLAAVTQNAMLR